MQVKQVQTSIYRGTKVSICNDMSGEIKTRMIGAGLQGVEKCIQ